MSVLLEPGQKPAASLVQRPHDPYWDSPPTRHEVMRLINDLALNDNTLSNRSDTAHLVINLLCEKLGITTEDINTYVVKKSAEIKEYRAKVEAEAKQKAEADAQSNG